MLSGRQCSIQQHSSASFKSAVDNDLDYSSIVFWKWVCEVGWYVRRGHKRTRKPRLRRVQRDVRVALALGTLSRGLAFVSHDPGDPTPRVSRATRAFSLLWYAGIDARTHVGFYPIDLNMKRKWVAPTRRVIDDWAGPTPVDFYFHLFVFG